MRRTLAFLALACSFILPAAHANTELRKALVSSASQAKDLELPSEASSLGFFASPKLALYKPDGDGPFPAVVLLHQCGGLRTPGGTWQNTSVLQWAKEAVARGHVALVLDSLGPRGVDSVCHGPKKDVNLARGAKDAFQAAQHLRSLQYVDPARIYFLGFSWGAMVGLRTSSKDYAAALADGPRFTAAAALYPGCFGMEGVPDDLDGPTLVLMGGQDTETPPGECTGRFDLLKRKGAPIDWHVYPEATHCWDCRNLNGFTKRDWRGASVTYRYDSATTTDSVNRVFSFFERSAQKGN